MFRYVERTIHQAMIQKLARVVSGLHAARLLLEYGLLQEQGAIQRMLEEFHEDILFLAYAAIRDDHTKLHKKYLDSFYEEEFDEPSAFQSTQKRQMVKREKIRAYVMRVGSEGLGGVHPCRGIELSRTLYKATSGFVHGASSHIMDMYGGNPLKFNVHGMRGTRTQNVQRYDLWNYFFRSVISFSAVAMAFQDEELFERIRQYRCWLEKESKDLRENPP